MIMPTYPGGKNGAGVFQTLINQIPPHDIYIEPFLGGGAIMRHKLPAPILNMGIDLNPMAVFNFQAEPLTQEGHYKFIVADALSWLASYEWTGREFVYIDPPYLMDTRKSKNRIYQFEFYDCWQHENLLKIVKEIGKRAAIMISGYRSELYEKELSGWRYITYQAVTRSGKMAEEWAWMNYPEPIELHDYRYLGEDYRERERIKRKTLRWKSRLERLPILERRSLMIAIRELDVDHR